MVSRKRQTSETMKMREVAERLGIGINAAYEAARRGDIPTLRLGKLILVPRAAFERLLAGEPKAAA